MANPQKENGYTAIASEIMEQLTRTALSGHEFRLLLLLLRKTYGFNKKEDHISLSQMAKISGLSVIRCSQVVHSLSRKNIITITEKCKGKTNKYRFNKHYEAWVTITEKCKCRVTITEKCNQVLQKSESTKDTITKDNYSGGASFKEKQQPKPRTAVQEIVEFFKQLKGYKDPDWNGKHFSRHTAPAKELLRVCNGDIADAKACMKWVADICENKALQWTLETVYKKEPDYRVQVGKKDAAGIEQKLRQAEKMLGVPNA
jgi:phage replication O-like protein O